MGGRALKNITKKQWTLIAIVVALSIIDVAITLYGAWFQSGTFFEANPLFRAIGIVNTVETFAVGLVLIKGIGIAAVVYIISVCNTIGEHWGGATCIGSNITCGGLLGTMVFLNVWMQHFAGV